MSDSLGYIPFAAPFVLQSLLNVDSNTVPSEGDTLLWNSTKEKWVPGAVPEPILNNFTATRAPTATDDADAGYTPGSAWVDTVALAAYLCEDATVGAAVWLRTTPLAQCNYNASVAPAVSDDSASGYSIGSIWVDTTADIAYICVDASVGAAIWKAITPTMTNNLSASAAPTVNDDSGSGYTVGSYWVDTTADEAYICVDASVGAAIWAQITGNSPPLSNYSAVADPTVNDDSGSGYSVGSTWINTSTTETFTCTDASVGAAVWSSLSRPLHGFFAHKSGNQTIPDASGTIITGYSTQWTVGTSGFNESTGIFTAPVDGYYMVLGGLLFFAHSQALGDPHSILIRSSAGNVIETRLSSESATVTAMNSMPPLNGVLFLAAGATLQMEAYQSTGGSVDITEGDVTYFGVIRVRL